MLPLKKILAPTDFSEPSYLALDQAIELAGHFGAELCLLHVVPYLPATPPDLGIGFIAVTDVAPDEERLQHAMQQLREIAQTRVPASVKARCEVKMGYPDKEIVCVAQDGHFDWLVIATHGLSGWRHMVFGSVAESIVRQARCPVLTVHATPAVAQVDEELPLEPLEQEIGLTYESTRLLRA